MEEGAAWRATACGAYRIDRLIGAGGMREVYRARDTKLGRDVAIKVLPDAFAEGHRRWLPQVASIIQRKPVQDGRRR